MRHFATPPTSSWHRCPRRKGRRMSAKSRPCPTHTYHAHDSPRFCDFDSQPNAPLTRKFTMKNRALNMRCTCTVMAVLATTACGALGEATSATYAQSEPNVGGAAPTPGDASISSTTSTSATTSGSTTSDGNSIITTTTTTGVGTTAANANPTTSTSTTTGAAATTTTTGGTGTTTGGTTTSTSGTACAETWTSYAKNFFTTNCVSCHSSMGAYSTITGDAATMRVYISSRSMPRGSTLSAADYNKILDWFDCSPATPE